MNSKPPYTIMTFSHKHASHDQCLLQPEDPSPFFSCDGCRVGHGGGVGGGSSDAGGDGDKCSSRTTAGGDGEQQQCRGRTTRGRDGGAESKGLRKDRVGDGGAGA